MNKQSIGGQRQSDKNAISSGGNNVIMEMDAENNEDESYYLSQSPVRKGHKTNKLSSNASNFVLENAGNQ